MEFVIDVLWNKDLEKNVLLYEHFDIWQFVKFEFLIVSLLEMQLLISHDFKSYVAKFIMKRMNNKAEFSMLILSNLQLVKLVQFKLESTIDKLLNLQFA
jgi:hypothetical protein